MTWVYGIPAWLFTIATVLILPALSAVGLLAVRRRFPRVDNITHNDVAGPIVATLGTMLAVVVSFMVVTVWQEFDQSAATVQSEVSAICDLYHDASVLPQPEKGRIQSELARYVDVVVRDEWPLMQHGGESAAARESSIRMIHLVASFTPHDGPQAAIQSDMIGLTHAFTDARRKRLFDNQQAIPISLWLTIVFITIITVASTYLFRVANLRAHLAMIVGLTASIAVIFALIAEFDLPFRGDIHVPSSAFALAFRTIASDPPSSVYSPNGPK